MHAQVLGQKDGEKWKGEAEAEDRGELREPQSDEIAPPVDAAGVDGRGRRAWIL
jgi:hypothetical protein